jgi:hypothetical protein
VHLTVYVHDVNTDMHVFLKTLNDVTILCKLLDALNLNHDHEM